MLLTLQTVMVKGKLDKDGKATNPLMIASFVSDNYVLQKAWTQKLEARVSSDATETESRYR